MPRDADPRHESDMTSANRRGDCARGFYKTLTIWVQVSKPCKDLSVRHAIRMDA